MLHSAYRKTNSTSIRARPPCFSIGLEDIKLGVIRAEYAVRGDIIVKFNEIMERIKKGEKFPFEKIIPCNIGNPFVVGKKSLSFPRQLIAAIEYPELMKHNENVFPDEVIERAHKFLESTPGSPGAYSHSQGYESIRKNVSKFIEERDGYPSSFSKIYLTNGASAAIRTILDMIISARNVGILTPIPTYPLYTATVALNDGQVVPYYLNEQLGWELENEELIRSIRLAQEQGLNVKALVVINPGNPTGKVLSAITMKKIIEFCEDNKLMLIADEVYQANTYDDNQPFISFKKLIREMNSFIPLISLHSTSKGIFGECGHRGGYMEVCNLDPPFLKQLNKMMSIQLGPNSVGQIIVDAMCNPPKSNDCLTLFNKELQQEYKSLKYKSKHLFDSINKLPGIHSQRANGAMYLYPSLKLPQKAIQASKKTFLSGRPVQPDMFWAMKLLEETGIIVVPGSGLGQAPGTYHFRTTFLPDENTVDDMINRLSDFQRKFMIKYSD